MVVRNSSSSAEVFRSGSKHRELPNCDDLRTSALLLVGVLALMSTKIGHAYNLKPMVQAGFAITGFLLAGFLLRERVPASEKSPLRPPPTGLRSFFPSLPLFSVAGVVAGILYLPTLMSLERIEPPSIVEIPGLIERAARASFSDFQKDSFNGTHLMIWPLALLIVPRATLGLIGLAFLGSGLMVQLSGLISGAARPISVVVGFSPLDLIAAGALVSAILQGASRPANGPLARWAILMGVAMAAASIGFRAEAALATWGSLAFMQAAPGFGAVNFILKLSATTMISALAWRDMSG